MSDEQSRPQDSIEPTDELTDEQLVEVAGGVEHSEIKIVKLLDASTPKINDGTSNTLMVGETPPQR
jgi:hypothetical protein